MKITAVIPAYNEEQTIASVSQQLSKHSLIDEVIVVSDGSTDNTVNEAQQISASVIELSTNQGKGAAMKAGLDQSKGDIILFMDADLLGLKDEHIEKLVNPVITGKTQMTIGLFSHGKFLTDLAQKIAPFLSGQRAVKKEILNNISGLDVTKFGVEVALNQYIKKHQVKVEHVILEDLSHRMKEEKLGLLKGFIARLKMYADIIKSFATRKKFN